MSLHRNTRLVVDPAFGAVSATAPMDAGGTNSTTAPQALATLKLLDQSIVGADNGVASLDINKLIPQGRFSRPADQAVTVQGTAVSAFMNTDLTFKITNYDSRIAYTIVPILGTYTQSGDTITYNTGTIGGAGGFTINGKTYSVTILAGVVNPPVITSPTTGAVNRPAAVMVTATVGSGSGYIGGPASVTWQLATDSGFTNIVQQSVNDRVNITSWTVSGLTENTTYYIRCKSSEAYNGLWSDWSTPVSFTTRVSFVGSIQTAMLLESDWVDGNYNPSSINISEDGIYAFVSSQWQLSNSGAVYVFKRTGETWAQIQKLVSSDLMTGDYFGGWVAISSGANYIAIGAFGDDSARGSVYIFTRSGDVFTQQAKLIGSATTSGSWAGYQCDLSYDGTVMLMGAHGTPNRRGAGYIFRRTGTSWSQEAILTSANAGDNDCLGDGVSLSGDGTVAILGATQDGGGNNTYAGSGAWLSFKYMNGSWTQSQVFDGLQPFNGVLLGASKAGRIGERGTLKLSYDGSILACGSWYGTGKVFVFTRDTSSINNQFTYLVTLTDPDNMQVGGYGISVSVTGDGKYIYVGSNGYDSNRGAFYIYKRSGSGYTQQMRLTLQQQTTNDRYGGGVSVSRDGFTAIAASGGNTVYNGPTIVYR